MDRLRLLMDRVKPSDLTSQEVLALVAAAGEMGPLSLQGRLRFASWHATTAALVWHRSTTSSSNGLGATLAF